MYKRCSILHKQAICIIAAFAAMGINAYAQNNNPMDANGRQPVPEVTNKTVLLPEFCARAEQSGDSIRRYEFYNAANQLINADTVSDYRLLRFVSLLEGYMDHAHTYKDAAGKMQPLPVVRITQRYDRISDDKWLHVSYRSNKTLRLQEHATEIVRTDSVRSADGLMIVRKYYRVREIP